MNVFIVEDSEIVRERISELLSEQPGVVVAGETGTVRDALEFIPREDIDVVILDLHLLDGSGLEVLRRIKQKKPGLWVIVLTNYSYTGYRDQCLDHGADYFLNKSVDFDQLPEILRGLGTNEMHQPDNQPERAG